MAPSRRGDGPPQISVTSWLLGGPIITGLSTSRRHRQPDLVTTEPIKEPKSTSAPKPNGSGKTAENSKMEDKKPKEKKPEEKKPEEVACEKCEGVAAKKPEEDSAKKPEEDSAKKMEEPKAVEAPKAEEAKKSEPDSDFTPEQDALLLRLKAENTSWKQIAVKMDLAKSEVQQRYKELQKAIHQQAAAAAGHDIKKSDGKTTENTTDNNAATKPTETTETSKDTNAQKPADHPRNRWDGVGGNWIEANRRLKPDDIWSREDCELLEFLEARYINEKWLQMQSKFYNWTGRMIRAEIIERKMKERGPGIGMNGEGLGRY